MGITSRMFSQPGIIDITGLTIGEIAVSTRTLKRQGPKIAFCGDSITNDSETSGNWICWGWVSWYRRMLAQKANIEATDILATSSIGTAHLLSTQLPSVLAGGYDICITMIGTNDLGSAVDIVGNLTSFYDSLESAGIYAIALPILPHSGGSSFTAAQAKEAEKVNKFLADRAYSSRTMRFVNTLPAITDYSTGDAASGILRDGIHTTKIGAHDVAEAVHNETSDLFLSTYYNVSTRASTYDETDNPNGNIVQNGIMAGSSGSLLNGALGVAADNWALVRNNASATFDITGSKITNPLGYGEAQKVVLSGTGDASTFTIQSVALTAPSGIEDGDILEATIDVEWDSFAGVNYLNGVMRVGTTNHFDGASSSANGDVPAAFSGIYRARGTFVAGQQISVRLNGSTENSASMAGNITIKSASIRKIT